MTPRGGVIIYSPLASVSRPLSLRLVDSRPSLLLPSRLFSLRVRVALPSASLTYDRARKQTASTLSRRASRLNGVCASVRPSIRSFVRLYPSSPGSFRAREYVWVVSRPVYARLARMPFLPRLLLFVCKLLPLFPISFFFSACLRDRPPSVPCSAFSAKDIGKGNGRRRECCNFRNYCLLNVKV